MSMDRMALIQKLFSAFPNATATDATLTTYLETLEEVPTHHLDIIVRQCIREGGNFPPSAGQVLRSWLSLLSPIREGAERGWLSVQNAMRDPINYTPEPSSFVPAFRDAIVRKVVAAMGWYTLRMSDEARVDQAQFIRMYNSFAEREERDSHLLPEYRLLQSSSTLSSQSRSGEIIANLADVLSAKTRRPQPMLPADAKHGVEEDA